MVSNEFRRKHRKEIDALKPILDRVRRITHIKDREVRRNFGEDNPDKVFYIIRNNNINGGMFSLINTVVENIMRAEELGAFPFVDMMNYPNSYLAQDKLHLDNSWEYYFKQPSFDCLPGVSLNEVYQSRNVYLSNLSPIVPEYHFDWDIGSNSNPELFRNVRRIFCEKIQLRDEIVESFDRRVNTMFNDLSVLGVLCRGTDYINMKPYAHPIQPSIEQVIKKVDEYMTTGNYDHIYLSTEDFGICKKFNDYFGSKLIIYPRTYVSTGNSKEYISEKINSTTSPKQAGFDYLCQIYLLTKCESAILSKTSALPYILCSSSYNEVFVWNLGRYGFDD